MANAEHLEKLVQGVLVWNEWRKREPNLKPDLREADLAGRDLRGYDLSGVDFTGACLQGVKLDGTILEAMFEGANLLEAVIVRAVLVKCCFDFADLRCSEIHMSSFEDTRFKKSIFRGSIIRNSFFELSDFIGADFGSKSNERRTEINRVVFKRCMLEMSEFKGSLVKNSYFELVNMKRSDMEEVTLSNVKMVRSALNGSNLALCSMIKVTFSDSTDLTDVKLNDSNIEGSYFVDTMMDRADFANTRIEGANFKNIDLRTVAGLDSVSSGIKPSSIDRSTIYKSISNLHRNFRRLFFVYSGHKSPLNMSNKGRYLSCYIAYDYSNIAFVRLLDRRLYEEGILSWCRFSDIRAGERIDEEIERNIALYDKTVLILSSESVRSWHFCHQVCMSIGFQRLEGQYKLLPVSINRIEDLQDLNRTQAIGLVDGNLGEEVFALSPIDFFGWEDSILFEKRFDLLRTALQQR